MPSACICTLWYASCDGMRCIRHALHGLCMGLYLTCRGSEQDVRPACSLQRSTEQHIALCCRMCSSATGLAWQKACIGAYSCTTSAWSCMSAVKSPHLQAMCDVWLTYALAVQGADSSPRPPLHISKLRVKSRLEGRATQLRPMPETLASPPPAGATLAAATRQALGNRMNSAPATAWQLHQARLMLVTLPEQTAASIARPPLRLSSRGSRKGKHSTPGMKSSPVQMDRALHPLDLGASPGARGEQVGQQEGVLGVSRGGEGVSRGVAEGDRELRGGVVEAVNPLGSGDCVGKGCLIEFFLILWLQKHGEACKKD